MTHSQTHACNVRRIAKHVKMPSRELSVFRALISTAYALKELTLTPYLVSVTHDQGLVEHVVDLVSFIAPRV